MRRQRHCLDKTAKSMITEYEAPSLRDSGTWDWAAFPTLKRGANKHCASGAGVWGIAGAKLIFIFPKYRKPTLVAASWRNSGVRNDWSSSLGWIAQEAPTLLEIQIALHISGNAVACADTGYRRKAIPESRREIQKRFMPGTRSTDELNWPGRPLQGQSAPRSDNAHMEAL